VNYAIDAKTFLKHFSDCLFYFCFTCADSIMHFTHLQVVRVFILCDAGDIVREIGHYDLDLRPFDLILNG